MGINESLFATETNILAKTKTRKKNRNKSEVIREILKKNPTANVKQVQADLKRRGVQASDALVNKVKYGRSANGAARKSSKRGKRSSKVNKAEAIRGAWRELGLSARPRDVTALLASRGLTVASAQVSMLRKTARGKQVSAKPGTGNSVPYEHLLEAKGLAARLGGIEQAQAAVRSLAELIGA